MENDVLMFLMIYALGVLIGSMLTKCQGMIKRQKESIKSVQIIDRSRQDIRLFVDTSVEGKLIISVFDKLEGDIPLMKSYPFTEAFEITYVKVDNPSFIVNVKADTLLKSEVDTFGCM